jgi:hypothetical protein
MASKNSTQQAKYILAEYRASPNSQPRCILMRIGCEPERPAQILGAPEMHSGTQPHNSAKFVHAESQILLSNICTIMHDLDGIQVDRMSPSFPSI